MNKVSKNFFTFLHPSDCILLNYSIPIAGTHTIVEKAPLGARVQLALILALEKLLRRAFLEEIPKKI